MTKIYRAVLGGILLALLLAFAVQELPAYPGAKNLGYPAPEKAPDFVLKDLQGRKFQLSENRGKPVLLVFGTTWCPSCREEIPRFKEIYANYVKKGLIMVNVDIQESRDKVSRFAEKYKLPYRVLLDETAEVAKNFGVRGVPTSILVDREGMIASSDLRLIESLLGKMLKGK